MALRAPVWRKSHHSGDSSCVEVCIATLSVGVRDSKDIFAGALWVGRAEWQQFLDGIRGGRFDRPSGIQAS